MAEAEAVRIGVAGCAHVHVFTMVKALVEAGARVATVHRTEGDLSAVVAQQHPDARAVDDARAILEDPAIQLVVCAGVPDERARLGAEAMRCGKDFFVDKPGAIAREELEALRAAQRESGRIFFVYFSERFENAATVKAAELAARGAVGRVLQTVGLGPHRLNAKLRPPWFFERARYGGILTDLASHQIDQFLLFTGTPEARVAASRVANHAHPEHPGLEDFGELLLEGRGCSGYARVDWFTPDGLETWGDVRLLVTGTAGMLEVRKNCDPAGREGGNHVIRVDAEGARHVACNAEPISFGADLLADVRNRTETALPSAHCLRATELALRAQAQATRAR